MVICCGSGGVGKTTVSASLAAAIASVYSKRVLVLTIDPARRLATALGMTGIGSDPVAISASRLRRAGLPLRGELAAAMLDQKSAWDRMIERYAPSREVARRIMANRFYQGISDSFVGSHEYMAMELLYELHEAGSTTAWSWIPRRPAMLWTSSRLPPVSRTSWAHGCSPGCPGPLGSASMP